LIKVIKDLKTSGKIRFVVIVLGLILSASLIYNYKYTKTINEGYKSILMKESMEFQAFQSISYQVSNIQRALLNIAIVPPAEYGNWKKKIMRGESKIDSQFHNLEMLASGPEEISNINKLKESYEEYKVEYTRLMSLLLAEDFEGTRQAEKIKELGTTYETYMKQQKSMLLIFNQNIEDQSNIIENQSVHTSEILLFFGTLPVLLGLITLIAALLVILWLSRSTDGFKVHD